MRTTFDIVDILVDRLLASPLKNEISGVICRRRPMGSSKEDVVVNSLPVSNEQLQRGTANVNIYVPNMTQAFDGQQDGSHPDYVRLQTLSRLAIDALGDQWGADYNFDIQQQTMFEDQDSNSHYINIRIDFYSINLSN